MKLRRTMKAQSTKKKEKERNNNNNKEKRRGSQSGKRKDLDQAQGHVARILVKLEDMQQEESTSRPYVCSDFQQKGH